MCVQNTGSKVGALAMSRLLTAIHLEGTVLYLPIQQSLLHLLLKNSNQILLLIK